ncbi:separin isoform X2 [Tribolium madens]|uniref:separin isoform X2 n=1 Tax=Tribolium madens TaxID=41895 RepID=UPI001CF75727|nr:separin isoform X2 [Tribolium madens]
MENKENVIEITKTLKQLPNIHYPSGVIYQRIERLKAHNCLKTSELEAIYHLVESHVPSLRLQTVLRYEKLLTSVTDNVKLSLDKNHVASSCTNTTMSENINNLLNKIEEMPMEWTLVQLTPHFTPKANVEMATNKHYTTSLYISVFICGLNQPKPFCVSIEAPKDSVTGAPVELAKEIHSIFFDNKQLLLNSSKQRHFQNVSQKQQYYFQRKSIDDRLKMLVKDLSDLYLKEWKCLFMGKYINGDLENKIQERIQDFFKTELPSFNLDEKTKIIMHYLVKSCNYLKITELRRAVQSMFSEKNVQKSVAQFIRNLSEELNLFHEKRHPLILIIDDSLDIYPWEMMEILSETSVSRLPSLYLAYALYKEHKDTIKDGFKIVKKPQSGTYLINPDLDLVNMQNRIESFCNYWLPTWEGIIGARPTNEQFEKLLLSGEIFSYNGHGNGSHFFSTINVEKIRINAVVLLFGCGSTRLTRIGPQTEMSTASHVYLIACSPCTVGMLWEVTDLDTDILATEFLSYWLPNKKVHWKHLDKTKWKKGEKVEQCDSPSYDSHEPELLKALSAAKKSPQLNFYTTRAGCVARGIPVKIITK